MLIRTPNLLLSPCTSNDATDFIALERDPEVMHFLNGGAVDHAYTDPNKVTFLMPRGTEPYVWTARRKEGGAFVGWFCLFPESSKIAEIGYRLRRQDWGQGLASEGAAALISWGFNVAGYDTVVACTSAANLGSRRVMEKIGMQHTHTVTVSAHDEVWYEVTRAQWAVNETLPEPYPRAR